MPRIGEIHRTTKETDLHVRVDLDGAGRRPPCARASGSSTTCSTRSPGTRCSTSRSRPRATCTWTATTRWRTPASRSAWRIAQALGDRAGIRRYADALVPLDEALVRAVVDVSGRPYLSYDIEIPKWQMLGDYDVFLTPEFFRALVLNAGLTVHWT